MFRHTLSSRAPFVVQARLKMCQKFWSIIRCQPDLQAATS